VICKAMHYFLTCVLHRYLRHPRWSQGHSSMYSKPSSSVEDTSLKSNVFGESVLDELNGDNR
jgi:hypothetical protein